MGTRSLTYVYNGAAVRPDVIMHRQMDGYPSGHGRDLVEFLKPIQIVNGIGGTYQKERIANGSECLAAQLVAHFKDGPGDIYLTTGTSGWEDYHYIIRVHDANITVTCKKPKSRKPLFQGTVDEFEAFCVKGDEE